ncbi:Hypothetical protein FKW44_017968 [Caligus rogercresseyi]|uniref:Uncharacterized protein n=1 Tax=Caligus rogercresseyi TaxID=217165 RepID=A0A7T8GU59_CALRO|nr:Hypothetical protein FKW44_017968 [Caligus rogercresseyi]
MPNGQSVKIWSHDEDFQHPILTPPTNHSHDGDPLQSEMRAVKSRIRENAGNPDNHSQTKAIIAGGLSEVSDDVLQGCPKKQLLRNGEKPEA